MEKSKWIEAYKTMQLIRLVEQRINDEYKFDEIKTPIHLSIGREAVSTGVCIYLRKDDYALAHIGAMRCILQRAEISENDRRVSEENRMRTAGEDPCILWILMWGYWAFCYRRSNIPIGTGTALASKLLNDDRVTVVFRRRCR